MLRILISLSAIAGLCVAQAAALEADPDGHPAASAAQRPSPTSAAAGAWRYQWHHNRWWYWLPAEKWVVWSGERWVDPAALPPATAPRRSYSIDARPRQGSLGPIRYDRFGNPQYPYSKRKTGVKQWSMIPAPSGVRAWPGWGGDR